MVDVKRAWKGATDEKCRRRRPFIRTFISIYYLKGFRMLRTRFAMTPSILTSFVSAKSRVKSRQSLTKTNVRGSCCTRAEFFQSTLNPFLIFCQKNNVCLKSLILNCLFRVFLLNNKWTLFIYKYICMLWLKYLRYTYTPLFLLIMILTP